MFEKQFHLPREKKQNIRYYFSAFFVMFTKHCLGVKFSTSFHDINICQSWGSSKHKNNIIFFLPENWTTWHKIAFIHFTCTLGQRQSNNNEIKVWWNEFHWKLTFRVNLKFIYGASARNKDVLSESRTRFLQREVDPHS